MNKALSRRRLRDRVSGVSVLVCRRSERIHGLLASRAYGLERLRQPADGLQGSRLQATDDVAHALGLIGPQPVGDLRNAARQHLC